MVNLLLRRYVPQTLSNTNKNIYKPLIETHNQKKDYLTAQIYRNNLKYHQVYPLSIYDKRELIRKLANGWGK